MSTGNDEVKRENTQPDPVSTTAGGLLTIFFIVDLWQYGCKSICQWIGVGMLRVGIDFHYYGLWIVQSWRVGHQ